MRYESSDNSSSSSSSSEARVDPSFEEAAAGWAGALFVVPEVDDTRELLDLKGRGEYLVGVGISRLSSLSLCVELVDDCVRSTSGS